MKSQVETLTKELAPTILKDLSDLVNSNSYTTNYEGVAATGAMLQEIAAKLGFAFEQVPFANEAGHPFHLKSDMAAGKPFIAMIGHFDTVHPPESPFHTLEDKGDQLMGPGAQDMKSGLIVALYALHIANKIKGDAPFPVRVVFNADEEIGSPDSRALIEKTMAGASQAFIFEGRKSSKNALVTSRKGVMMGQMTVTGRPAHAGEEPQAGASAILEAARKILALDKLNDSEKGIIVTIGTIEGGRVANQIPDKCSSSIDVRFTEAGQDKEIFEAVKAIMDQVHIPGCSTTFTLETARPSFAETKEGTELFENYATIAKQFGVELITSHRGGVSDANFTAAMGIPSLDGVGAAGDYPHTNKEYIDKGSLFDSINTFALYLLENHSH